MKRLFINYLILLSGIALFCGPVPAQEITVQLPGGIEKVGEMIEGSNIEYFSLSELAKIFGERLSWKDVGFSVDYPAEKHRLTFFIDSPYFKIDDSIKNLTFPVRFHGGELYVPAQTFVGFLGDIRDEYAAWDPAKKTVRISPNRYNITDLTLSAKANGLLIEIFVREKTDYEIFTSEGNWLNITVPGGKVNQRQILSHKTDPVLLDMNVFQLEKSSQISLRLRQEIVKYTHRFQTDPDRIQISLVDTAAAAAIAGRPAKVGPDKNIDRVIIDAGHGGSDYGAIGFKASKEKEIVLDIARRLAKLIRKDNIFSAVMTRDKDESITLSGRADAANRNKGDIFVSIHANASLKKSARGFQVFFLAPAKNDSARAAAQLENAPFLAEKENRSGNEKDDLSYILSDMIQTEFQTESADLAAIVERELRKNVKETSSRGIDQAGFFVLNGVYMPSILVETAFVTNRDDEKLLGNKDYREKVAQAIYDGLKKFKTKYEGK